MSAAAPFVSVIVPTHDRPTALARCLSSLAAQLYPGDRMEIVVVNDGGLCVPRDVLPPTDGIACRVIDVPHGGPAAARNAGVEQARGEILAFVDDDCAAERDWLGALVARLAECPEAVVGGRVLNALAENRYARSSQILVSFLYGYYHEQGRGALPFFTTNNLAVSRRTFEDIGPFDPGFSFASEDRDWSDRCLLSGRPLVYAPEAVVYHAHFLTLGTFLHQHFRYGEGARRFHRTRALRRGTGVRLESVAFYRGMLLAPFDARDPEAWRVAALLAASQAVAALGWARAAIRSGGTAAQRPPTPG